MGEYDGKLGTYGDHSPVVTSTGTLTTSHELNASGATPWDSPTDIDRKLRAAQFPFLQNQPTQPYVGPSEPTVLGTVFVCFIGSIFCLVGWLNLQPVLYRLIKPDFPVAQFPVFSKHVGPKMKLEPSTVEQWNLEAVATFGHLYGSGAPVNTFLSNCAVRPCRTPDFAAFQAFKRYAVNPAGYESAICQLNAPMFVHDPKLQRMEWVMTPQKGAWTHECKLADPDPVFDAHHGASQRAVVMSHVAMGLICVAFFVGAYLLGRQRKR